ncbi:MAG TPA: asparagine synthase-related protein, partial [Thermoanaerobaculia bacterium]
MGGIEGFFSSQLQAMEASARFVASDGSVVLCDGRIDNLDELRRAHGPANGDALEVLHATWRAHGDDFASRVIGDFAIAIWDPARCRLLLTRDPFGIRPLFHAQDGDRFVFASRIRTIVEATHVPLDVDEEFIAEYLAFPRLSDRTPFRAIRAVAPGHVVVADANGVTSRRWWSLARAPEVRLGSDVEYEQAFRELFFEAVRARLDVDGTAFAELSGGLDSSSIVCVADRLLAERRCRATSLETISYVFDESSASDERFFIGAVEHRRGRRGVHLREEDHRIFSSLPDEMFLEYPTPIQLFGGRGDAVLSAMESAGARVLLRGTAGDQVLWGESNVAWEIGDLVAQSRWRELRERLRVWSLATRKPYL